ncbi:MAG: peptide chain release factor N(5)-glutamine methyltransferase [Methyloceanibacter sp.]
MRDAFVEVAGSFRRAGMETPELDARLLLGRAAGMTYEIVVARVGESLASGAEARLQADVKRRLAGEPVSRILGEREFYGRTFLLDPSTLDPRSDTETLIEAALDLIEKEALRERPLWILDLGTGTGCILVTLLAELPLATGVGTDIGEAPLAVAAANARRNGVETRAAFLAGDWLDPVSCTFDLILANPPYIATAEIEGLAREVALHDPRQALDGGADGLAAYRRIAAATPRVLREGGMLIVEIGSGQAEAVTHLLAAAGLTLRPDAVRRDLGGRPRAVLAQSGVSRDTKPPNRKNRLGKSRCSG